MIVDGASDRLEDRLERLAKLHTDGELDADEYRAAKALLLSPDSAVDAPEPTAPSLRAHVWGVGLLVAVIIGFTLACLGSVFTTLQGPAGPILCSNGDLVAGNVSEHYGGTTSYNIDSSCVSPSGDSHHLSQVAIIGVLWVVYTIAVFACLTVLVVVARGVRALRGPPLDSPDLSELTP